MAPASRARSTRSRWLKAVSTMTGAIRSPAIFSAALSPSRTGIWMSRMTRSGRSSAARSTACWPSPTSPTTSYPSSSSISLRSRRISASSSAMRTRVLALLTGRSLAMSGARYLPDTLLAQPVSRPARPRTPIGRGSGFKTRAVCVRVAPGAPARTVGTQSPLVEAPQYGGPVTEPVPHMSPEQFRQHGHEVVDWIADYWARVGSLPVRSQVSPGEVRAALPEAPPETGQPFADVLADLDRVVLPGLTHWQHPGFFGYFPANTSGPSVLGDLVSAGLGVQGMSWVTSPACTELEQHLMDWFAGLLGLPESFLSTSTGGGVVQDSSSGANLVALLAALHRVSKGGTVRYGVEPETATVYVSAETHSSMEKAVRIAGLGSDAVRIVEGDDDLAMRPPPPA